MVVVPFTAIGALSATVAPNVWQVVNLSLLMQGLLLSARHDSEPELAMTFRNYR